MACRHIHPGFQTLRTITVREAARLQTFDDDYVFEGSNVEMYKMIGNAVPPKFAKCLARPCLTCFLILKKERNEPEQNIHRPAGFGQDIFS